MSGLPFVNHKPIFTSKFDTRSFTCPRFRVEYHMGVGLGQVGSANGYTAFCLSEGCKFKRTGLSDYQSDRLAEQHDKIPLGRVASRRQNLRNNYSLREWRKRLGLR